MTGSAPPDDRLREAIQRAGNARWNLDCFVALLLAMTKAGTAMTHPSTGGSVGVANPPLEQGTQDLEVEGARGGEAALGREGAADRGAAARQPAASKTAVNEFLHWKQVIERAFLVQYTRAA